MPRQHLAHRIERHALGAPFRISGHVFNHSEVVVVTLTRGDLEGRGEAAGVYYLGDDAAAISDLLERERAVIEGCTSRQDLRTLLPAGGARNAVDCAMWDLEAAELATPVWKLAGVPQPNPLVTTMTLSVDAPEEMAAAARDLRGVRAIKIKLAGDLEIDLLRVQMVRAACPDIWLGVDANQGYKIDQLAFLVAGLQNFGVQLIEQPLARGREADLDQFESAIPLAADESALTLRDTERLRGRFDMVNIKLDKCGGLTEALMIARRARALGLSVMVGNMIGTSLAMVPASIVGQLCDVVDLDGPLFLKNDPEPRAFFNQGMIHLPEGIWGSGRRPNRSTKSRNMEETCQ